MNRFHFGLFLFVLCMVGCAEKGEATPELFTVEGVVMLDDNPLANATVAFNPVQAVPSNSKGAIGTTDNSGQFTMQYVNGDSGVPEGEYTVTVSKLTMPDGSPIPEDVMGVDVDFQQHVPKKYLMASSSPLKAKVSPSGSDTTEFKLTSK